MKPHLFLHIACCPAFLAVSAEAAYQDKIGFTLIFAANQTVTSPSAGAACTYVSVGSNPSGATMGRDSSFALGISNIAQSANSTDKQGMAFFNVGGTNYTNLFGFAYNYTGTTLTLYAGGFSLPGICA